MLVDSMNSMAPFQSRFAQDAALLQSWTLEHPGRAGLLDVVRNAKPTALIGVSGQPGAFSHSVVREMAAHNARPVIFPLSNPTSRAEATPADLETWTEGRAIIGTGSPFPPLLRDGKHFTVDQTNNSYIFPGVGLGAIAVQARRITDTMFMAAAKALADTVAGAQRSARQPAAAGHRAAGDRGSGGTRRREAGDQGGAGIAAPGARHRRGDCRQNVGPEVSALPPIEMNRRERAVAWTAASSPLCILSAAFRCRTARPCSAICPRRSGLA